MNLAKTIKTADWHIFHKRLRSPFFHQIFLTGTGVKKPGIPFNHQIKNFGTFHNYVTIEANQKSRLAKSAITYSQTHPQFLLQLMRRAYVEHQVTLNRWRQIHQTNFDGAGDRELSRQFKQYVNELLSFGIYVSLPLFVEDYLEDNLRTGLNDKFGTRLAQKYFNTITTPAKNNSVITEELALLNLAAQAHFNQESLRKHQDQFSWMANTGYFGTYYSYQYYLGRLRTMRSQNPKLRLKKLLAERQSQKNDFNRLLKQLKNDRELYLLAETANEAVFFRSWRTELYYGSAPYVVPLFKAIAKHLDLRTYQQLYWFYWTEINDALTGKNPLNKTLIEQRRTNYVMLSGLKGKFYFADGTAAATISKDFIKRTKSQTGYGKLLKGAPAYPGRVIGTVCLVPSVRQLIKVKRGSVLMTHATNINFTPALKKVAAIVTEEGGILSHAAMISRELRIPCIIGTKIATQVFKDGDLVEVDANSGIVKKLN